MPAANQRPENELRAEAYLSRVSALQSELTCQLQHLRALRAHGRAASGAQDVLTPLRLRQVQRRVEQLRADLSRAQREVAWAVGRLPNPRARTLMEMRYLSCLTWDEIAQALYASPRAALRMHQRALRQVDILLAEREEELKDEVSLEKHVTPDTPPTFLWHTWTDELVPVENSLMFAAALRRAGVPCEMHIFGAGQHGLSLCNDQVYDAEQPNMHAECACWIDMAARWLKGL